MNDYKKRDFYHFYDEKLNQRRFYLKVQNSYIEVSKEVYYICYNSYRKQMRDSKRDYEYGVVSYDKPLADGNSRINNYGANHDYIDELYKEDTIKEIMGLINTLSEDDKKLIIDILILGRKEKDLAEEFQITQQMISKRKGKIIKNLRKKLKSGCERIKAVLF